MILRDSVVAGAIGGAVLGLVGLQLVQRTAASGSLGEMTFKPSRGGKLLGYKVMEYDPASKRVVSGADRRISLPMKAGSIHTMRHPGIFLGASREYVMNHYAVFETNALLTYEFDLGDVTTGNVYDREPEITVSKAKLLSVELFNEDGDPL